MFPSGADSFIVITRTRDRVDVAGLTQARVDQPWGRDRASSDVFAEWHWDGTSLVVRNDEWAFEPLFYFASSHRIAVSTSIPVLLGLGAPVDLDDIAMAVFLRLSHFLGTDTPFRHIRTLPRCGRLTWRPGTEPNVSSKPWRRGPERLSRASVVDGYVTLFRQAVRRRLPAEGERVVVPLSGGHDSRHILFELVHAGCRPAEAVTIHHYPPAGDDDAAVASEVANTSGVAHTLIPLDPRRVALERRKNLMTSFCADRHAQMMPIVDYLRGRADVIFDGLGGDIVSGSRLERLSREMALFEGGRCDELAERLLNAHSSENALNAVLQPAARRRFGFEAARAHLARELRRHVDAPHPWGSYRMQNRTARSVALLPLGMLARSARVMTPYLDRDLTEFLGGLPASALADGQLHTEVISRAFPEHAHLRYEDRVARSGPAPGYYRRLALDLAGEALGMPSSPLLRRPFVASRLVKPLLTGTAPWIPERRVIYLMQLEEAITRGAS